MAHKPTKSPAKRMRCKLTIRGGRKHHRRPAMFNHLYFDRMITVEQAGHIIAYLAQFKEPRSPSE